MKGLAVAWSHVMQWAFWGLCLYLLWTFMAAGWVSDDSFITLRVIDNFVNGFGLRWNTDERVQVYTHPLWMWLELAVYGITRQPFISILLPSIVCVAAALWLLLRSVPAPRRAALALVVAPLGAARMVRDYACTGLETPLSLLLVVAFFALMLRSPRRVVGLLLLASGALLTRLDTLILLAPALAWLAWQDRRNPGLVIRWLLGFSPLLAWHAFSLFYYGFAFPNTKYAKLNTSVPLSLYVQQGYYYLMNLWRYDKIGAAAIYLSGLFSLLYLPPRWKESWQVRLSLLAQAGIVLHMVYVVCVGGDFMSGRFFVLPFVLSVMLLYWHFTTASWRGLTAVLLSVALLAGLDMYFYNADNAFNKSFDHGIVEEKQYYYDCNGFFNQPGHAIRETSDCYMMGELRDILAKRVDNTVYLRTDVGVFGYYAGPQVIIIDEYALADALLARLPTWRIHEWRTGHFWRDIPPGYPQARQFDDPNLIDETLRPYYEKMRLITAGPLFSGERLQAIFEFHAGEYDHWLKDYVRSMHREDLEELEKQP